MARSEYPGCVRNLTERHRSGWDSVPKGEAPGRREIAGPSSDMRAAPRARRETAAIGRIGCGQCDDWIKVKDPGRSDRDAGDRVVNQMQEKKWKLYYVNTPHLWFDDKTVQLTTQSVRSQEFDSREEVLAQACEYRVRPGYRVDRIENPEGTTVLDRVAIDALCAALP
jgi:hypothetical protein